MKAIIIPACSVILAASLTLIIGCALQDRNNQFDPGGVAYSNSSQSAFAGTNIVFFGYTNGSATVALAWPSAAGASSYRIYLSTNETRPATALMANVSTTNTAIPLASIGSNFIWVEAGTSGSFINGSYYVYSGWSVDSTSGNPAPSLRCINIPVGKNRDISFPGTVAGCITTVTNWCIMRTVQVTGNLSVIITVSNASSTICWTNNILNVANYSSMPGNSVSSVTVGISGGCSISVKNTGDTDGFNALWIDDVYLGGTTLCYSNDFATATDNDLVGDKLK